MRAGGQEASHWRVVGPDPRHQVADAAKPRRCDCCCQQEGPHTVVLRGVVYRHGELLRLVAKRLEDDMPNDAVAGDGDETVTTLMVGCRELDSLLVTDPAGCAKEAQSAAASRQLGVEALERDGVVGRDPTDSDVVVNHAPMVRVGTRPTRVP